MTLDAWRAGGQTLRVFGHDVFTRIEGPADGPALLFLHGFPSSSMDLGLALPQLARRYRVVMHDHVGFGLSSKPEAFSYSLVEQADVALGVWRALGVTRGHLVAHDYGTSVATELLARRDHGLLPITLHTVTLCNGSVHIELARPRLAQHLLRWRGVGALFARLTHRAYFKAQVRQILGDPLSVDEGELDAMWDGVAHLGGRARMPQLIGYIDERTRFWNRWIDPLTRLDLPAHVLWGRRDPVALPAVALRLAGEIPGARLTWLEELGHYPMLEAPDRWSAAVLGFLDGHPPAAGRSES
jgi:pimeloyl-ACP methyl ester carboxylesterase